MTEGEAPARYEYDFQPDATNDTAAAVYRYAREGGRRVLDLGCGPGIVAAHLHKEDGRDVTGVDLDEALLVAARERGVERTIRADLESPGWSRELSGERFDVIVLADVLEHLREPERVLAEIRDEGLLAEDGFLVVSIPNASHAAVVLGLLAGRFAYTDTGLLDRTHVRWFTRDSFAAMCEEQGYLVTRIARTTRALVETDQRAIAAELPRSLQDELAQHAALETRTYQYVMRVEPASLAVQLRELRAQLEHERGEQAVSAERAQVAADELDRLRKESDEALAAKDAELGDLRQKLAALEAEHREVVEQQRLNTRVGLDEDGALGRLQSELRSARRSMEEHLAERRRLERKLEMVYESSTWRAGNALLWLPKKLKRGGHG